MPSVVPTACNSGATVAGTATGTASGTTIPNPTPTSTRTDTVEHSTTASSTDPSIGVPTVGLPVAESAAITDATTNPASTATASETKLFLPEGATIRVLKPELEVRYLRVNSIPEDTVSMRFKLTDNVAAIKGLAVERLKTRFSMNVDVKKIVVTRNGERLKNDRPLYDLVFPGILAVAYPEDGIATLERKESIDLDLEPDFFSFFD